MDDNIKRLNSQSCGKSMHDFIALGDYKNALDKPFDFSSSTGTSRNNGTSESEILRLPLLLRLLSSSQHLSSIDNDNDGDNVKETDSETETQDQYVNDIVNLLEMMAASQRSAENIDHLATFLAPEACRPISKLLSSSVKRRRRLITIQTEETAGVSNNSRTMEVVLGKGVVVTESYPNGCQSFATSGWDDSALKEICGETRKDNVNNGLSDSDGHDHALVDNDDQSQDKDNQEEEEVLSNSPTNTPTINALPTESPNIKRKRKRGLHILDRKSLEESDLPESTVCKTLLEVLSLVSSSLSPTQSRINLPRNSRSERSSSRDIEENKEESETQSEQNYTCTKSAAAIKLLPASLLSEPAFSSSFDSELSATFATLMHHSPIIRHEHLSNALCRASVPHCAIIVKRLAANCPAASTALLRGCINACILADLSDSDEVDGALSITQCARDSVEAIASLSSREAMGAVSMLRQSCVTPDLMFQIMVENDAADAIAILWDGLRRFLNENEEDKPLQNGRYRIRIRDTVFGALRPKKEASLLVVESIRKDSEFASRIGTFIVSQLESVSKMSESGVIWGQAAMIVQSLGMYAVIGSPLDDFNFTETSIAAMMNLSQMAYELVSGRKANSEDSSQDPNNILCEASRCDAYVKSALASCIVICFHSFSRAQTIENGLSCLTQCFRPFHKWHVSVATRSFALRIADLISQNETQSLWKLLLLTLLNKDEDIPSQYQHSRLDSIKVCEWAKDILPPSHTTLKWKDTKALVEMGHTNVELGEFDEIIKRIFGDLEKCNVLYEDEDALTLIETSIVRLENMDSPTIPLILPLSIGKVSSHFLKDVRNIESMAWRQLILHLVYTFVFLEKHPKSPFSLNPRSLQLREIIQYICESPPNILTSKLLRSIDVFCPEFLDQGFDSLPHVQDGIHASFQLHHKQLGPMAVAKIVQNVLSDKQSLSPTGRMTIERIFLSSRAICQSNEVDVEVARALLTSVGDSFHFLSYSTLCTDPLVLLKCSLKVWFNNELRRILLLILNRALMANDKLVRETKSGESTVSECLASRDTLVVRSFVFLLSSSCNETNDRVPLSCPLMISMVRFMVAQRPGLSASIIKQGLPEIALDWFIHNIPEVFNDAQELSTMLENRSLNIVEKSRIADGGLRIAIVHGSCDNISQRLVYNALSVLISSFYIVIGPVGVPVNVLCDDKEQDITQSCREHLFRMLATLQNINSRRKNLKGEAILALSKLASLCKTDAAVGDLSANALQKRKKLLEKVWDSVKKVNEALGGGVQL
jgi:hypothetical protein